MFNLKKCRRHSLHYLPKSWHFLTCCTVRPQRKKKWINLNLKFLFANMYWGEASGTTVSVHSHWGLRQALRMDFHWCINGQNYKQRRLDYHHAIPQLLMKATSPHTHCPCSKDIYDRKTDIWRLSCGFTSTEALKHRGMLTDQNKRQTSKEKLWMSEAWRTFLESAQITWFKLLRLVKTRILPYLDFYFE